MHDNLETHFHSLSICDIIFGICIEDDINIQIINFLILIGKWYINKTKTRNEPLYFIELLRHIKEKVEIMMKSSDNGLAPPERWLEELHSMV